MPEGQRLVISYKGGMDADDGDTLVFDQGSTASPDGRFLLVTIKDGPEPDGELDFTAADGGGEAGETITFTFTIPPPDTSPTTNDISPWTVTHGGGGELLL